MNKVSKLFLVAGLAVAAWAVYYLNSRTPVLDCEVVREYPHDPKAFTQGLVFEDGIFYEGTGQKGKSQLRKVKLETGEVFFTRAIEPQYFGEGITVFKGRVYQLTYKAKTGFVYDKTHFKRIGEFALPSQGWGLTHDGTNLVMSDGTAKLYFMDPATFRVRRTVVVHDEKGEIRHLNELENVGGRIYANVWKTYRIAIIRPEDGRLTAWIDLVDIMNRMEDSGKKDVMNGIAWDAERNRLFVTGKWWPKLFEIRVR